MPRGTSSAASAVLRGGTLATENAGNSQAARNIKGNRAMGPAVGQALEIPLTVEEAAGVERVSNAVNSGVPLPRGAVKDAAALRLLDAQSEPVLAMPMTTPPRRNTWTTV